MLKMDGLGHVYFEAEDRPPPSYWQMISHNTNDKSINANSDYKNKNNELKKIDPKEWLKAPEFIPRSKRMLHNTFNDRGPNSPNWNDLEAFRHNVSTIGLPPMKLVESNPIPGYCPLTTTVDMPQPVFNSTGNLSLPMYHGSQYMLPLRQTPLYRLPGRQMNQSLLFRQPFGFIPPGYSANLTEISSGIGPPIPALVLKKRRRRRNRRPKSLLNSIQSAYAICADLGSEGSSTRESTQVRVNAISSEPDLSKINQMMHSPIKDSIEHTSIERKNFSGSCPDLSDSQLQLWENLLYDTIVKSNGVDPLNGQKWTMKEKIKTEYDVASRAVLDTIDSALHIDGICSKEVRKLDYQLQGKTMEDSMCEDRLIEKLRDSEESRFVDSPASITKSLKAEIEELTFRPIISQYGYPEINPNKYHLATFNPDFNTTSSTVVHHKVGLEEDCFEGINLRVNTFENGEEFTLSDSELPRPSRFQQIQWALQRKSRNYSNFSSPHNVCCSLM